MTTSPAELRFREGLALCDSGRFREAAESFRRAIAADRESGAVRPQMRYLSFYGLSRALAGRATIEEIRLCERAAKEDSFDPTLLLNLGRVYLLARKTTKALAAFERGLRIDPSDRRLRAMLERTDRRARPVIARLGRDHVVNRSLGRLLVTLRQRGNKRAG